MSKVAHLALSGIVSKTRFIVFETFPPKEIWKKTDENGRKRTKKRRKTVEILEEIFMEIWEFSWKFGNFRGDPFKNGVWATHAQEMPVYPNFCATAFRVSHGLAMEGR
jgi:hypothetical protein